MYKSPIVRLYGRADNFEIEFTKDKSGRWNATIPPDLDDGQYAVELHAVNAAGERAYWTGILYMHSGRACLHLAPGKRKYHLLPVKSQLKLHSTQQYVCHPIPPKVQIKLTKPTISIRLERMCICGKINF